ncbi:MAG: hypothetical protein AWU57_1509 [Marinobacter sp. T13-3]|nr:MAG: hypothetical protein AWU57_1509 [Marinobacter sp. T13-3]
MSTTKKSWVESLGYTKAHLEAIESAKTRDDSVQISGDTTSVKRADVRKLVADVAAGEKSLENCGQQD